MSFRTRSAAFWGRHRALLWRLHSVWALATGVVVILLARERYAFVPWVVVFLGVTWLSTLFFGRSAREEWTPTLGSEVTSYITRTLYQETLFFLLPFYAYSTLVRSPNVIFLALLGGLAVLSCLDLVFDRWLRTKPVFGLVFFASVAFAAINLLLPMLSGLSLELSTPLAAGLAVATSLPLAYRGGNPREHAHRTRGAQLRVAGASAAVLAVALLVPSLIPPVPLRMRQATFASEIDRTSLTLADTLRGSVGADRLGQRIVVLAEVFSPGVVPTRVQFDWRQDGVSVRTSPEVDITAHEGGFRVWDALTEETAALVPGRYEVILRTAGGRWFGRAQLTVSEGG